MHPVTFLPALLLACGGGGDDKPTTPEVAEKTAEVAPPSENDPAKGYYHTTQGSGMLNFDLVMNVERADSNELFSKDLERFGLIPAEKSETNPHGLPIGLAVDQHDNLPFKTIGQTCAACHQGQITYQGNTLLIDGGQGLFHSKRFFDEFLAAFDATFKDKDKLFRLITRLSDPEHEFGAHGGKDFASAHPLEAKFVEEVGKMLAEEIEALEVQADGHKLVARYLLDGSKKDVSEYAERLKNHPILAVPAKEGGFLAGLEDEAKHTALAEAFATHMHRFRQTVQMMKYTKAYLGASSVPYTPQGPGRIDAFGMVRAQILTQAFGPDTARPLTGPASIPHLWNIQTLPWLHWQSNMNTVVGRNALEAIGSGAILDFQSYDTWANLDNLAALETLTYGFEAPKWPGFFPALDQEKVALGKAIYHGEGEANQDYARGNCVACHAMPLPVGSTEEATVRFFSVDEIGVDGTHAANWAEPVQGQPFPELASDLMPKVKSRYYDTHDVPSDKQLAWEGGRTEAELEYRVTDKPLAGRPLQGVWATAPYLHNGAVPTLVDLLSAPESRPKTFPLGHREYDPVKVGYTTNVADPVFVFDVNAPVASSTGETFDVPNGNGNGGHAFGVALSDDERMALVEYLKTL